MTTDVYITSTLHSRWNLEYNPVLCRALEERGITCYLPQRDTEQQAAPEVKCASNIEGIKAARKLLAICENETPNWGIEVGYAQALGKPVIILVPVQHQIPLMVGEAQRIVADDLSKLESFLDNLIAVIQN